MNVLFYSWDSICEVDMIESLQHLNHNVITFRHPFNDYLNDYEFFTRLTKNIMSHSYDFIFSFNYFPIISEVCTQLGIPYVSWSFDCPLLTLFCNNITNSCNYIFIFDKILYQNLKSRNINTVHYLPLAVNTKRLEKLLHTNNDLQYSSDVSFVGSLYLNQNFYDKINYLPDYIKGYLDGIMQAQLNIHGYNFLPNMLSPLILDEIKRYVSFPLDENYFADDSFVFSNLFLSQKVTSLERTEIINRLSQHFKMKLYTNDNTSDYKHIQNMGVVNYHIDMPKVFRNSKINLNITLRSIESGIPLRAFDIMGSSGFLLSNFQSELFEFFEPNKDFVYYESNDDLIDKINYFITHEKARMQIAENGFIKVSNNHTYEHRILEILKILNF